MFRKEIVDKDLMIMHKPHFFSSYVPYRNLSGEVRELKKHVDEAAERLKYLGNLYNIASTNVKHDLEEVQELLENNSNFYIENDVDNSILCKREGIIYSNREKRQSHAKAPSNKEHGSDDKTSSKKGKSVTVLDLISKGKISLQ